MGRTPDLRIKPSVLSDKPPFDAALAGGQARLGRLGSRLELHFWTSAPSLTVSTFSCAVSLAFQGPGQWSWVKLHDTSETTRACQTLGRLPGTRSSQ